jgi:hypothetical protein
LTGFIFSSDVLIPAGWRRFVATLPEIMPTWISARERIISNAVELVQSLRVFEMATFIIWV